MIVYWITQKCFNDPKGKNIIIQNTKLPNRLLHDNFSNMDDQLKNLLMSGIFNNSVEVAKEIVLEPKIPASTSEKEDKSTKRICVSTSIAGALSSIANNLYLYSLMYIYKADIPIKDIYQPSKKEVPDVDITGELWLLKPTKMNFYKAIKPISVETFNISLSDDETDVSNVKWIDVY